MRIVHVSDIHVRNFKYHWEYAETFVNLYADLLELRPDLIINTGDLVHSKTSVTPELVHMLSQHIQSMAQIAPYRLILGNHDLNLKNTDRRDAVSPVVNALAQAGVDVQLWNKNGSYNVRTGSKFLPAKFWVFHIADEENYPTKKLWSQNPSGDIQIGLFHGAISGCKTDIDWEMQGLEHDVSMFDGLDFVLMGDIHRHQFWNNRRIAYAGSLIQQNFGESPDKGYLVWDIDNADSFSVRHVKLDTPLRFCTVKVSADLMVTEIDGAVPDGSYVRILPESPFTSAEQRQAIDLVKTKYKAREVFVAPSPKSNQVSLNSAKDVKNLDIADSSVQETLLREYLDEKGYDSSTVEGIITIDRAIQSEVKADEDYAAGRHWKINSVGWTNVLQYGRDNVVDFEKVRGVYGIFGPNSAGKSSIFETITEGLYDRVTKDVPKNIDLINDSCDEAKIVENISVDDREYIIERTITRLKYGQRKKDVREWGKTALDFYEVDSEGGKVLLNGESRPETEKAIRRLIGGFDDFCLTSMTSQIPVSGIPGGGDFINCKDTDRRKLLYRFLGLELFERKLQAAKEWMKTLKVMPPPSIPLDNLKKKIGEEQDRCADISAEIERKEKDIELSKDLLSRAREQRNILENSIKGTVIDDAVDSKISEIEKKGNDAIELIGKLTAKISQLEVDLAENPQEDEPLDPSEELTKSLKLHHANELAMKQLESKKQSTIFKLNVLKEVPCGDSFPQCKFLIDAVRAKDDVPNMVSEGKTLASIQNDLEMKISQLKEQQGVWKEWSRRNSARISKESELESTRSKIELITAKMQADSRRLGELEAIRDGMMRHADEIKKASEIDSLCAQTEGVIKKKQGELNTLRSTERSSLAGLAHMENVFRDVSELEETRKSIDEQRRLLELYCDAVGKNGVPRSILVEALPGISREVNRIISSVTNFTVSFESDEDEQSLSVMVCYSNGKSRPVSLAGGAEKFITSLSIRAALCQITTLPRSNMFIVDEGFGKLDPENSQAIQRMFQYLRGLFDHILIVSHTEVMRDMVDGTIDIGVDEDGFAHVEHV